MVFATIFEEIREDFFFYIKPRLMLERKETNWNKYQKYVMKKIGKLQLIYLG